MASSSVEPWGLSLRVRSLEQVLPFYEACLGLERTEADGTATLSPRGGGPPLLELVEAPDAPLRDPATVGLYHLALLVPERLDLGRVVERLRREGVAFEGFADHGVSEAAYLRDPEGNGVELYADRAPEAWPRDANGIAMVTRPLDVAALLDDAAGSAPLPADTRLGHLHFHVASLADAERFYADGLGLAVTQRSYPGARFFASGGYHHHVGANTWAGERRAPDGATGIIAHAWVADADVLAGVEAALGAAGFDATRRDGTLSTTDPVGARVDVRPAP